MTDEIVAEQPNSNNELEILREELARAKKSIEAINSKKEELLAEAKKAKDEKRNQEKLAEQAKLEQAQKNGEFEKLWKQEQEEKQRILNELQKDRQERRAEKIDMAAMKIAADLAKGEAEKAELLSVFLAQTISKVADEVGRVESDVLASIKKQFEADKRFMPLLGGNKANGGSAPGNPRSAENKTTKTRAEFDNLNQVQRYDFMSKVRRGEAQLTD